MAERVSVLIAASVFDADQVMELFPQFQDHLALTPDNMTTFRLKCVIDSYTWTPWSHVLSPRTRLLLRGVMAPMMGPDSTEQEFPETLLE